MKQTKLDIWAEEIFKKTGFIPKKEIKRGIYYSKNNIRDLIFEGEYKGKPAILKIYNDPRITDEPLAQIRFNKQNKSKILKAAEVYDYQMESPNRGWLIMEKLPLRESFKRPLNPGQREEFLNAYLEYRKNFPTKPERKLELAENLPANKFHIFRIARWFQLAHNKEAELSMAGKKPIIKPKEFIPRYIKALDLIEKEFKNRKMIYCHGLFNPTKIFKGENGYYLIDFGHNKMYPEGYELSFILWSDWLMEANWKMNFVSWEKGVNEWLALIRKTAQKLKIKNFNSLIKACLAERIMGSILADICATERPRKEKETRIKLLYQLFDKVVK